MREESERARRSGAGTEEFYVIHFIFGLFLSLSYSFDSQTSTYLRLQHQYVGVVDSSAAHC